MRQRCRDIIAHGDALWSKRQSLTSLWQDIAENFYPERADFTTTRSLGTDFAAHLTTSYPLLARRELGNAFSSMLRPAGKPWYTMKAEDDDRNKDSDAIAWLEWATNIHRRAMYARKAQFIRATKECDQDFATFGQGVVQPTFNRDHTGLLYRTWHLRDCVWAESAELEIDTFHRKQKLTVRQLVQQFPQTVDRRLLECLDKEPGKEVEIRHVVMPAGEYDWKNPHAPGARKQPFVSIYLDKEHETVLEEIGAPDVGYVVPRWQTVSGSQYAHSPATVVGLSDARLLQRISLTLLEAGEKAVDPPMVAVQEAIQGGINIYAGGVTYVDAEYDERLGEVLRPLMADVTGGLRNGTEMVQDIREQIAHAFFLNKINLPEAGKDMTAYEVSKRMDEYVRGALPLFEPASDEYNGQLCEHTMKLLLRANAFGPPDSIPKALAGEDVKFAFESPITSATDRAKSQSYQEAAQLLATAAQVEQITQQMGDYTFNANEALRDAFQGIAVPSTWINSREMAGQMAQAHQEAQQPQEAMGQVAGVAGVAQQVGDAAQSLQAGGILPQDLLGALTGGQASAMPQGAAQPKKAA